MKKRNKLPEGVTEKNGRFYGVVYLGLDPKTKKKKRIWTTGFDSPKEAADARVDLKYQIKHNIYMDPSKLTVEEFLNQWMDDYVKKKLAPNTQSTYKTAIEKHIIPEIGSIKLQKLQPSDIDEYYDRKRQKDGRLDGKGGLSEKTLLYHHRILTRAFNYAIYKKRPPLLKENPAGRMADAPQPEKKLINRYEPDECITLIQLSIGDRLEVPINMGLSSDLRRGEVLGALWRCLNLNTGEFLVKYQLIKGAPREYYIKELPKMQKERTIVFPKYVVDLLIQHKEEQEKLKTLYGTEYRKKLEIRDRNGKTIITDNDLIFCHTCHTRTNKYQAKPGDPVHPDTFTHWFADFIRKHELPSITFHGLRHTGATINLETGVPLPVVSKGLGHDNPGFTGKEYHDSLMKTGRQLLADNKQRVLYDKVKR